MSNRALARRLGKSEGYVRDRMNGIYEFALADIENFSLSIGMNPEDFIASIDREVLARSLPERQQSVDAVPLTEILGGRSRGSVGRSDQDALGKRSDYDRVAREREEDRGEDEGGFHA